jgi:hypothetical protein
MPMVSRCFHLAVPSIQQRVSLFVQLKTRIVFVIVIVTRFGNWRSTMKAFKQKQQPSSEFLVPINSRISRFASRTKYAGSNSRWSHFLSREKEFLTLFFWLLWCVLFGSEIKNQNSAVFVSIILIGMKNNIIISSEQIWDRRCDHSKKVQKSM